MSNRNKNSPRNSRRKKQQPPQKPQQKENSQKIESGNSDTKKKDEDKNIMKLVVRSKYWGRTLEGKVRRSQSNPSHGYRVISCQAIADKIGNGGYWGCCPHHGRRVLELREDHFIDHCDGPWDLYFVGAIPASGNMYHEMFLLPREQSDIDVERHVANDEWKKLGTIQAGMARLELSEILEPFLSENKDLKTQKHHVHIQILMDQAVDREITRSKGKRGKSSVTTTEKEPVSPPLIPRAVSHDSSWANDTASLATHTTTNDDSWMQASMMCYPANQYWGDMDSQSGYSGAMVAVPPMVMGQHWPRMQMHMQVPYMPQMGMANNTFLAPGALPPQSMPFEGYPVGFVNSTYWEEEYEEV